MNGSYEINKSESYRAPRQLIEEVESAFTVLPGRVAVLVNKEKQTPSWQEVILTPDNVQALRDRMSIPPHLARFATVCCSGVSSIKQGETWLVHPDHGQWWEPYELECYGLNLPDNWQLRFYNSQMEDLHEMFFARYKHESEPN
jgi:hypothetical protein